MSILIERPQEAAQRFQEMLQPEFDAIEEAAGGQYRIQVNQGKRGPRTADKTPWKYKKNKEKRFIDKEKYKDRFLKGLKREYANFMDVWRNRNKDEVLGNWVRSQGLTEADCRELDDAKPDSKWMTPEERAVRFGGITEIRGDERDTRPRREREEIPAMRREIARATEEAGIDERATRELRMAMLEQAMEVRHPLRPDGTSRDWADSH